VVAARAAVVAWLVLSPALWARAADEAVGQESARLRIKELLDRVLFHQARFANCQPELTAQPSILSAVRAAVVVELDVEVSEVALVRGLHIRNELFLAPAFLPCPDHDGRAVRVVGAHVAALVAAELLKADPDIRLDVFDQVPDVNVPVGIGQGRGDKQTAGHQGWDWGLGTRVEAVISPTGHTGRRTASLATRSGGGDIVPVAVPDREARAMRHDMCKPPDLQTILCR
jgi:hypothetical protein